MAKGTTIKPLLDLGYTQAQLARMFEVDSCTTNAWVRANRVGERCVGRVKFIPELKGKVTVEALRPDLDEVRIKAAYAAAKLWDEDERDKERAREEAGARKARADETAPRGAKAKAVKKAASKQKAATKKAAKGRKKARKASGDDQVGDVGDDTASTRSRRNPRGNGQAEDADSVTFA